MKPNADDIWIIVQDGAKHKEQSDNRRSGRQTQRILGSLDKTEPNTENIRALNDRGHAYERSSALARVEGGEE
jgi:hypothetical protein